MGINAWLTIVAIGVIFLSEHPPRAFIEWDMRLFRASWVERIAASVCRRENPLLHRVWGGLPDEAKAPYVAEADRILAKAHDRLASRSLENLLRRGFRRQG